MDYCALDLKYQWWKERHINQELQSKAVKSKKRKEEDKPRTFSLHIFLNSP